MADPKPRSPAPAPALVLGLAMAVISAGCAPASEAASLRLRVDDGGSFVGVYAGTSAAGVEVDLDWTMVVRNRGPSPCAVAVYRWTDALPEPATLPSANAEGDPGDVPGDADTWPSAWAEGERVASAVVGLGDTARFELSEDPAADIGLLLGLAVCDDADLELEVRAEASADLGIRSIAEALVVELWRAG